MCGSPGLETRVEITFFGLKKSQAFLLVYELHLTLVSTDSFLATHESKFCARTHGKNYATLEIRTLNADPCCNYL